MRILFILIIIFMSCNSNKNQDVKEDKSQTIYNSAIYYKKVVEQNLEAVNINTLPIKKNKKKLIDSENKEETNSKVISKYIDNDAYFITDIDVNKDGIKDKVISSKPYQGDELLIFINDSTTYKLVLKTVNFSEDGGNQIVDIKEWKNGFYVKTAFLDRGFLEVEHYITFKNDVWMLEMSIYKTGTKVLDASEIYVCEVAQNIDLSNKENLAKMNFIPEEGILRDVKCFVQFNNTNNNNTLKDCKSEGVEVYIEDSSKSPTNIRDKPNGKILFSLSSSEYFIITTKEAKEGWFKLNSIENADTGEIKKIANKNCWIHNSVLQAGIRRNVALRSKPKSGEVVGFLQVETNVRIKDICSNWVKVQYENKMGWIDIKWICGNPFTTCP